MHAPVFFLRTGALVAQEELSGFAHHAHEYLESKVFGKGRLVLDGMCEPSVPRAELDVEVVEILGHGFANPSFTLVGTDDLGVRGPFLVTFAQGLAEVDLGVVVQLL